MPAHLVGHPIDELAMCLIGPTLHAVTSRPSVFAIDQRRNHDTTLLFGQEPGKLGVFRNPRSQARKHFWRLIRVWNGHDAGLGPAPWFEKQAFSKHAGEDRP